MREKKATFTLRISEYTYETAKDLAAVYDISLNCLIEGALEKEIERIMECPAAAEALKALRAARWRPA